MNFNLTINKDVLGHGNVNIPSGSIAKITVTAFLYGPTKKICFVSNQYNSQADLDDGHPPVLMKASAPINGLNRPNLSFDYKEAVDASEFTMSFKPDGDLTDDSLAEFKEKVKEKIANYLDVLTTDIT